MSGPRHPGPGSSTTGGARTPLEEAATSDRRLLSRSSVTLISRVFAKSAQIIFLVVAARLLTVEEFATYSYMLVLAVVFSFVSEIGVPIVAGRDVSAGRALAGDLYAAALPVVVVSGAVAALILPLFAAVDSGPGSTLVPALLVAAFVLFNRLFEFQATILRSLGRFNAEAAIQAAGAPVFIGGATAVTVAGLGVSAVLAVLCAKEAISALVAYLALRGDLRRSPGPPPVRWQQLIRVGIKLSVAGLALVLVMRLPLIALGNSGTDEEVALFSAAQRFGDAAWLLATTAGVALLPGVAYLAQSERARARGLLRRVLLTAAGGQRRGRGRGPAAGGVRDAPDLRLGTSHPAARCWGSSWPACRRTSCWASAGTRSWPSTASRACWGSGSPAWRSPRPPRWRWCRVARTARDGPTWSRSTPWRR